MKQVKHHRTRYGFKAMAHHMLAPPRGIRTREVRFCGVYDVLAGGAGLKIIRANRV